MCIRDRSKSASSIRVSEFIIMSFYNKSNQDQKFLNQKLFFLKQKTAYEIASGDWSSDVCSSDLYSKNNSKKTVFGLGTFDLG